MIYPKYLPILLVFLILAACQRQPTSTADLPRHLSKTYRISVAPFTQPINPSQLIAGQLPEDQGRIIQEDLLRLDMDLRDMLQSQKNRDYFFISNDAPRRGLQTAHSSGQPGALADWIQFGRRHNAQLLLVPMVLNWHEREGSQAGAEKSAHVRVEFFLLNIDTGQLVDRSAFEEKQVGLIDNLLNVGDFIKRKGKWVSARELAMEGMGKAIKELGL